ncbi:hypothetical protein [Gimesia sp.]|uniref:hypothetical protein n=1 Tax=Gimesia sp. TaxID=2024833 RepID=UPI003A9081C6
MLKVGQYIGKIDFWKQELSGGKAIYFDGNFTHGRGVERYAGARMRSSTLPIEPKRLSIY